ncbi:Fur family transcriptional regulator [Limnochorda pilosa]|uniref:Fur family transcriptional regulator n=1 Tax=Limnochorda pilosa TaxID=1555112 RepID=A0A0K2SJJ6_LIMPI|nr:transcriptional repressor [Limnochorda pilosa]BAS27029.1 Fur family transcriptional regulator [Limnochorda pilosa]
MDEELLALRRKGMRLTPQRQAIYHFLKNTKSHPSAEEIFGQLHARFPGLSRGTVYNTLNMLAQEGLVRELRVDGSASRFDADTSQHYHVVCRECGRLADYYGPSLDTLASAAEVETGYHLEAVELYFEGLCPVCRAERRPSLSQTSGQVPS